MVSSTQNARSARQRAVVSLVLLRKLAIRFKSGIAGQVNRNASAASVISGTSCSDFIDRRADVWGQRRNRFGDALDTGCLSGKRSPASSKFPPQWM